MHTLDNETLTTNFKNVQNQCPIKAPVANFMKWYDTLNPNSDFIIVSVLDIPIIH